MKKGKVLHERYRDSEKKRQAARLRPRTAVSVSFADFPEMKIMLTRVARFQGLRLSDYLRIGAIEKLYRQMKEGLLEHSLLAQPVTVEERAMIIRMYEEGKLSRRR